VPGIHTPITIIVKGGKGRKSVECDFIELGSQGSRSQARATNGIHTKPIINMELREGARLGLKEVLFLQIIRREGTPTIY